MGFFDEMELFYGDYLDKEPETDNILIPDSSFFKDPKKVKKRKGKKNVLYISTKTILKKEYLTPNLTKEEIVDALKDTKKMGRSFFGEKGAIAWTIVSAKNPELAVKNFNILMNVEDEKLSAHYISEILKIASNIDNKTNFSSSDNYYGYLGGELSLENIKKIIKVIKNGNILNSML